LASAALDSYFCIGVLVICESAMENRRRALRGFAMGIPVRILDDLGARRLLSLFPRTTASGTHTGHHRELPRAGVLNFAGSGAAWGSDALGSDRGDRAGSGGYRHRATS